MTQIEQRRDITVESAVTRVESSLPTKVANVGMAGAKAIDCVTLRAAPHVSPHHVNASVAEAERRKAATHVPHIKPPQMKASGKTLESQLESD